MELVEGTATVEDVDAFVETLGTVEDEHDTTVQAFDARYVLGREHLEYAVELATRAHERGEGIARELRVEILLYAAARRQINRALEMGVSEGECPAVAVVVGGDESVAADSVRDRLDPAETLGAYDPDRVRSFFDVNERELDVADGDLAGIVRERMALLIVER